MSSDTYVYDDQMNVWSSKEEDQDYMNQLAANGEDLSIVGIVQAKSDASNRMLTSGIGYPRGLIDEIIDIISAISRILMAFVSISLVVSSIMIGVITYISVLERRKEIGILRSIGASRHNIREVFNAETVITGLLSGGMGVGIAYALIPLANHIIRRKTGQLIRASLPPVMTALLILLSVVLTLLAGLIPSGQAARSDPVKALRSE